MKPLNVKEQLQGLINQAPATPMQTVSPLKAQKAEGTYHLNCWLNGEQAKRLKQYALDHDLSIKDTVLAALEVLYQQTAP